MTPKRTISNPKFHYTDFCVITMGFVDEQKVVDKTGHQTDQIQVWELCPSHLVAHAGNIL